MVSKAAQSGPPGPITYTIEGLDKTLKAFDSAAADSEDMKSLMSRVGTLVAQTASAPVLTGRLSGTINGGGGKTKAIISAGGPSAPYAGVIQYGWPARGIGAQPFLTNALDRSQTGVFKLIDMGISDLLRKNNLT